MSGVDLEATELELGKRVRAGVAHENFRFIWPQHSFSRASDGMPIPEFDVIHWRHDLGYRQ